MKVFRAACVIAMVLSLLAGLYLVAVGFVVLLVLTKKGYPP